MLYKRPRRASLLPIISWEIAYSKAALSLEWLQKALFVCIQYYHSNAFFTPLYFFVKTHCTHQNVWCFKSECLLRFSLVLRSKCINQKKLNVKTLSRPYTKRTHQRRHSKMCHLGMVDEQTQGVKLGISNIANYNSSRMGLK